MYRPPTSYNNEKRDARQLYIMVLASCRPHWEVLDGLHGFFWLTLCDYAVDTATAVP
ncbi:MAG: hypothetical protein WAO19_02175 [Candidatus Kryptoniota bacterium]